MTHYTRIRDRINITVCRDVRGERDIKEEEFWVFQWKKSKEHSERTLHRFLFWRKELGMDLPMDFDVAEVGNDGKLYYYPEDTKWDESLHDRVFKILDNNKPLPLSKKRKREAEITTVIETPNLHAE